MASPTVRMVSAASSGILATKLLLEGHDELDRVEAVGAEIIDEAGVFRNLVGLNAEMFHDDFFYPLANITHRFQPLLSTRPDQLRFGPVVGDGRGWTTIGDGYFFRLLACRPLPRSRSGYHTSIALTSAPAQLRRAQ